MNELLTTRQLQDLLQVDRITIYRMLGDGRLRGFKVGGQWRFSRAEINAWLQERQPGQGTLLMSASPAVSPEPAFHALPLACIRAIQAVCAEAMNVAAVTADLDGTPLSGISNSCQFCDLILSTAKGQERCEKAWRSAGRGPVQSCHAGLLCAGAPIVVGGQPVAVTAVCQFVAQHPSGSEPAWVGRLPDLARDLSLPEDALYGAASSLRAMPASQVAHVSTLVARMALTFEEIGQERLKLLGRLEKIAEMSKI
jgi:excisionase family DNA binding protein